METLTAADREAIAAATERDRELAAEAELAELVASQDMILLNVTTETIYEPDEPVRLVGRLVDYQLLGVKVRVTRHPVKAKEGVDHPGTVTVQGLMRPVNLDGRPRANGAAVWKALPARLAAPYIMRALTLA